MSNFLQSLQEDESRENISWFIQWDQYFHNTQKYTIGKQNDKITTKQYLFKFRCKNLQCYYQTGIQQCIKKNYTAWSSCIFSDMESEFNICKSVKVIHPTNRPITWKEK